MGTTSWHDLIHPGDAADFFRRTAMPPFDLSADGYSPGNACWLMELSRLVYRHDTEEDAPSPLPRRVDFLNRAGFRQIGFFQHRTENIDTQAMLVASVQPAYAVLVFRGTEPRSGDIRTDIRIWKGFVDMLKSVEPMTDEHEIHVHQGFKEALDAVWHDIAAALAALQCPVYFTGHSLGAALATLAAARPLPPCDLKAVYTFGSPRVGNLAFADSLAAVPLYRVANDKDVVASLPPERLGFVHAGQPRILRKPGSFMDWLRWPVGPPRFLADHAPINYIDRLK